MSFIRRNPQTKKYEVDDDNVGAASVLSTIWLLHTLEKTRPYARGVGLDVGCGTKPYKSFYQLDRHIGFDWNSSQHKLQIEAYAHAQHIPFPDATFDTVICTEVIEHLPRPWQALDEMARVLKPGGCLILSAPFVHAHHEFPHDYYRFTYFGIQELARQSGLQVVMIWQRGGMASAAFDFSSRTAFSFMRSFLRKARAPEKIQRILFRFLISLPQRVFAHAAIFFEKSVENKFSPVSLGYVLAARKGSEA